MGESGGFHAFRDFQTPPQVRISFIGSPNGANILIHGGVGFISLTNAEQNVSSFVETASDGAFTIEKLHNLIAGVAGQVESVGRFYSIAKQPGGSGIYPREYLALLAGRTRENFEVWVISSGTA